MPATPFPPSQISDAIAAAVFATAGAWVVEAYSDFDCPPRQFSNADEMADYAKQRVSKPRGSASFFVTYPDMKGRAVRQTIRLKPGSVPGHTVRYTWEGWGLIFVVLSRGDQPGDVSRVTANSETRAKKWEPTYPHWEPVSTWDWKAVTKHSRRLQRVLHQFSQKSDSLALDVLVRVKNDFAEKEVREVVQLLEAYRGPEADRVRRCVVHLSGGLVERLRHHLQTAAVDFRDVIFLAEYDSEDQRTHDFSSGFN